MLIASGQLVIGLVLLYYGAEALVRGSVALAIRLGISRLVVGLTVVAFATSSPEMLVGIRASILQESSLVLGNMIGSNICNVALILGVAAVIRPVVSRLQLLRFELPVNIAASLVVWWMLAGDMLTRGEAMVLLLFFLAYTAGGIVLARRESKAAATDTIEEVRELEQPGSAWKHLAFVAGGILMLTLGADFLVKGAVVVATHFGVSKAVIGLTIMALGTSLPELAAAVVASIKDEGDIVLGNIIGSNLFNILWVLGLAGVISPANASDISNIDLGLMTFTAAALLPIMITGFRIVRLEGVFLLAVYAGYVAILAVR